MSFLTFIRFLNVQFRQIQVESSNETHVDARAFPVRAALKTDKSVSEILSRAGEVSIQPIVRLMIKQSLQALMAPDAPPVYLIQQYYLLALPLHLRSARASALSEVSS